MLKGRIIGPPTVVMVQIPQTPKKVPVARLAVAVELDDKRCVPALLPHFVFPVLGAQVKIERNEIDAPFDFCIVQE